MLYKKYHRNYVKQFKKGAKVVISGCLRYVVDFSPSVMMLRPTLHATVIMAGLSRLPVCDECCSNKVLVSSKGKLDPLCHVIQKIS